MVEKEQLAESSTPYIPASHCRQYEFGSSLFLNTGNIRNSHNCLTPYKARPLDYQEIAFYKECARLARTHTPVVQGCVGLLWDFFNPKGGAVKQKGKEVQMDYLRASAETRAGSTQSTTSMGQKEQTEQTHDMPSVVLRCGICRLCFSSSPINTAASSRYTSPGADKDAAPLHKC